MEGAKERAIRLPSFSAAGPSTPCDSLLRSKALQRVAGAVWTALELLGWLDESRRRARRSSSRPRRPPVAYLATCFIALVGLVPLACYMAWSLASGPMSAPATLQALSFGLSAALTAAQEQPRVPFQPLLIPRLIHQTFKSASALPAKAEQLRATWRDRNPGWKLHLWDDDECRAFVRREFPHWYAAYQGLPKDVERADFFRYLVVLRLGGVYADIDTECRVGLDAVIRQSDTMVVGWEAEVPDAEAALRRHFSRTRQVGRVERIEGQGLGCTGRGVRG